MELSFRLFSSALCSDMASALPQVLYQSKLLLTALLSFAFLGTRFTMMQWAALLLLTIGVVAVEMSGTKSDAPLGTRRHHLGMGATAAFASALLSSCAGVYFEAVVKKQDANAPSLWVRNVQLCVFSVPLAACGVAYQWRNIQAAGGPLSGFDGAEHTLQGAGQSYRTLWCCTRIFCLNGS